MNINNDNNIQKLILLNILLIPIIQIVGFYLGDMNNNLILISSIIWILLSIPLYITIENIISTYLFFGINFFVCSLLLSLSYNLVDISIHEVFKMVVLNILVLSANYIILKFSNYNIITNKIFIILSGTIIIIGISLFKNEFPVLGIMIIIISIFSIVLNITCLLLIKRYSNYNFLDIVKLYSLLLFISLLILVLEELSEDSFIDHFIPPNLKKHKN